MARVAGWRLNSQGGRHASQHPPFPSLAAVVVALAGCAGTPFTFGQASQVKVGMTEDQLYEIMGNPYMVTSREDGQMWVYSHATAFGGAKSVSFQTKDGKVTKVPYIPKDFIAKPSPDE